MIVLNVLLRLQHLLLDKGCAVALRVFCLILEHTAAAAGCVDYNSTPWRPKRLTVHCIQGLSRPPSAQLAAFRATRLVDPSFRN